MKTNIRDYEIWLKESVAAGYEGPHTLSGSPKGEQFVRPGGEGTGSIWNAEAGVGAIFDPRSLKSTT